MDKIIFRGRRKDNGKWLYWNQYGEFTTKYGKVHEVVHKTLHGETHYYHVHQLKHLIDKETIGQYVGTLDKHRQPIFEGDHVRVDSLYGFVGKIIFVDGSFELSDVEDPDVTEMLWYLPEEMEIVK